jgi:hypothetical protein
VALLNDDYTPMEFVVAIIQEYFNKDRETATQIMLSVHQHGKGVWRIFQRYRQYQSGVCFNARPQGRASPAMCDGGSMIAQELEVSLHMAFVEARQARHEFITVEHLLLALLDNPSAAEVLRACAVNIEDLRKTLTNFIGDNTPTVPGTGEVIPSRRWASSA